MHFDAVVVYLHEDNELNFIKDTLTKYEGAPIKAFLGKTAFGDAAGHKAKAFTEDQVGSLVEFLKAEYDQLQDVIKKVFTSFDTDGSGFIDSLELQAVSKELGKPMDAAELEECLKDLDQNKDGKISLEEFSSWWLSGRQGLSPWMRRLLGYKLNAIKFVGSISGTLKETIEDAANQPVDIAVNSLSINLNKVEHAGFSIYVKAMFLSQEVRNDFHTLKGVHTFTKTLEDPAYFNLSFDVVNITAQEFVEKLNVVLQHPMVQMFAEGIISVVAEGHKVNIGVLFPAQVAKQIRAFGELVNTIQNELKVDQSAELHVRLAASPKDLLEDGAAPVLM